MPRTRTLSNLADRLPAPATVRRSFAPVANADTRVLILGSLPGEMSLARAEYYGNPRNQFWKIMGALIDIRLVDLAYEARLAALLSARVGLWDVIASASRSGSLDSDIRNSRANALRELISGLPALQAIAFNGGTAANLGRRELGEMPKLDVFSLPSSSPANTTALDSKQAEWNCLVRFVSRQGAVR